MTTLRATGRQWGVRGTYAVSAMLWALSCLTAQAQTRPARPASYTAQQTVNVGGKISVSILHVTTNAVRVEDMRSGVITIVRNDRKLVWALLPAQRAYMELPLDSFTQLLTQNRPTGGTREAQGSEQVGEYGCAKARVHTMINGTDHVTTEWSAPALGGLVIKRADAAGKWSVTYSSVHPGSQSAALFEVPSGYARMSMPAMNH